MKIKFDNAEYTMVGNHVNVMPDHFQVTILKGGNTIDDIIRDATTAEEIRTFEDDGTVAGVYHGYTELIAVTTYDGEQVSVELGNSDIQAQIEALATALANMKDTQDRQNTRIEDVAEVANDLVNSQATQDLAIEDLGEAVSELTPEEV